MSLRKLCLLGLSIASLSISAADICKGTASEKRHGAANGPVISASAVSQDGGLISIGVDDEGFGGTFVFQLPSGKLLWSHRNGNSPHSLAFSTDGQQLAIAYRTRSDEAQECPHVEVLRTSDGLPAMSLEGKSAGISGQSVAFSHDGVALASAVDWELPVWNLYTRQPSFVIELPEINHKLDHIQNLAFSPDDSKLAGTSGALSAVYVWKVSNGKMLHRFAFSSAVFPEWVNNILFSDDGLLLAAGSGLRIKVFTLKSQPRAASPLVCQIRKPPHGQIVPVAFTPEHNLWVNSSSGLDLWSCPSDKSAQRLSQGKIPFDTVFQLKDRSLVGVKMLNDWRKDPSAGAELSVMDTQSGKQIAKLLIPGR